MGYMALREVVKVDAHKSREQSKSEGWEEHWKGNNAADETAKLARTRLQCDAKTQQRVIIGIRKKRAKVAECCNNPEGLWKVVHLAKKTCLQAGNNPRAKAGVLPHAAVYHRGQCVCSSCGRLFKKPSGSTAVVPAGRSCSGRSHVKEAARSTHCLRTANFGGTKDAGRASEILFCSQCGAYGTHKVVRLKRQAPATREG